MYPLFLMHHFPNGRFSLPIRSTRSDRSNSPTKLDWSYTQLLPDHYSTPTHPLKTPPRLQPDNTPISIRSSQHLHNLYSTNSTSTQISTWPDQPSRTGVMGYWSNRGRVDLEYQFILSPRYLVPGDKIPRGILSPGTLYPGVECPHLANLDLGDKIP